MNPQVREQFKKLNDKMKKNERDILIAVEELKALNVEPGAWQDIDFRIDQGGISFERNYEVDMALIKLLKLRRAQDDLRISMRLFKINTGIESTYEDEESDDD